ncbi:hypothetical protein [Azomonas macrocytogenes]|uniref:Uncharacterized protein n=1 Tax=Azomonas macrocytogenes TaxID=69962 RepID=A0A839T021_AZOMA|nr:hypothetical protein [Azomonas macrocytogenes]MBB3102319.1 hypothetical protein [Azomonas macrocytogenes]
MKTTSAIPENYAAWRHCITVQCGIPLTADFIQRRLQILRDPGEYETQRFAATYGTPHLQAVIGWYEQAEREL